MGLNLMQSSYFCDDQVIKLIFVIYDGQLTKQLPNIQQIDDLNNTYFAFCSQYEQSTQYVQTQSQIDGTQLQISGTDDDLTEQPQKLDFQAAFLQFVRLPPVEHPDDLNGSDPDLNVTVSENVTSHTDFEAQTHAVIIQNPHLANTAYVNIVLNQITNSTTFSILIL